MVVVMADVDITSLSVEISAESQGAELNIDKLATAISNLRTKGNVTKVVNSLDKLASSIATLKQASAGMSGLDKITSFLNGLSNVNTTASAKSINTVVNAIKKIPAAVSGLNGVDFYSMSGSITQLTNALAPLSILDASNLKALGSAFNAIGKVPDLTDKLKATDLDSFASSCQKISTALTPLASQLDKVSNAFAKLPPQLSKVVTQANRVTAANEKQRKSYLSLSNQMNGFMRNMAKLVSLKAIAEYLGNAVAKFNDFYEATDMFTVSMGEMTESANQFINKMESLLGIDPTEAMNNMANVYSMVHSFGMASDKAYTLSQNLTQLGYDLASLKNMNPSETFTKLRSAMAGELEPVLQLGVDISQARLQQELLELGFNRQVSTLSQADKATLRYIAIMKQLTYVQGNLGETLSSPANMIRMLKAQLNNLARDIGSLLYPALKSILPPLIAAVELIREFVQWVAKLMGVKVVFTDFTKSADSVGGIGDAMDDTADSTKKAAKALKDYTMGFDELNIIDPTQGSSGSGSGASGGNLLGGVDLSSYDMFSKYDEGFGKQIDAIKQKIKAMLPLIATVATALAAWKLTNLITDIVDAISKMNALKSIVLGLGVFTVGVVLEITGIKDAIENGVNGKNFAEIVLGALIGTTGAAILGKGIAQFIVTGFGNTAVGAAIKAAGGSTAGAIIGAAVGGIVTGIPMFATGVYDAVKNGLNTLNGILIPLGSTMAGAGIGAIIGSLGGPIGAGVGALIGLAVGALTDLGIAIAQNWDTIKSIILSKWNDLKSWWSGTAFPAIQSVPSKVGDVISSIANWFSGLPEKIGYALGFAVGKIGEWVGNMVTTVITEVPKIVSSVVKFFEELPGNIWTAILKTLDTISEWRERMIAFVVIEVPKIISSIVGEFKKLPDELRKLGKFIWDGLINGLKDAYSTVTNGIKSFTDGFVNGFKEALEIHSPSQVFHQIGVYVDQGLANGIIAAQGYVDEAMQGLINGVTNAGNQFIEQGKQTGIGFVNNLDQTLTSTWQQLDTNLQNDFLGTIQNLWEAAQSGDVKTIGTTIAAVLWHAMGEEQRTQIKTIATNMITDLSTQLTNALSTLSAQAYQIGGELLNGITSKFGEILQKTKQLGGSLSSTFQAVRGPLKSVATAISAALSGGLASAFPTIYASMGTLISTIGASFVAMLHAIGAALSATIFGIPAGLVALGAAAVLAVSIASIVGGMGGKKSSSSSSYGSTGYDESDLSQIDYSNVPGTSQYNDANSGVQSSYTASATQQLSASEIKEAVYNGAYNALLDYKQRYGNEDKNNIIKLFIDGKQVTAAVEKTQSDRGRAIMGNEAYSY